MSDNSGYGYIDLDYINEIAGDEDEFVVEIITNYLSNNPSYLSDLNQSIKDKDYKKILFFAHKLKGSFKFVGAAQLSRLAESIELLCEDQTSFDKIEDLYSQMIPISEKVVLELNAALAKIS